jgi:hypothetical protein
MPSPERGFVLVLRVWFHDGVPVARILADPDPDPGRDPGPPADPGAGPPSDSTTVAGREAIVTAVRDWVTDLDPNPNSSQ